ncbi:hypothetical protein PARPLA_00851 [Rhodobacteraceae bacterium THAF1]|uniref:hypothetical protein n=1 Tax=Palleronia sp. THAF1 TaxID=2587842 RepID=UPI000F3BC781|nr:hypothetical protein [Palleronia sp. THAF1]QFU09590.1 hypothetical protein FIU81_13000 [Palleronia sp. THAF1]VDC17509.1 hypothetical protein PARPLA_00851 [Rhodobacteraceae bacterium THAF1]
MKITTKNLLLGTALTLPMTGFAFAQDSQITEDMLSGKSDECVQLGEAAMDANLEDGMDRVMSAIEADNAEQCDALTEEVVQLSEESAAQASDSAEASASDSEQVSEQVTAETEVDVEAVAQASVADPNVDVQMPGPEVSVTPATPSVTVDSAAPEVEIEQQQPTVGIEIPEIIVRVNIPAPNVYILTEDPTVSVSQGDPQVEVTQGEPNITVTQPDPTVDLNIAGNSSDGGNGEVDGEGMTSADDEEMAAGGNVSSSVGEPTVQVVTSNDEPQVQVNSGGEPTVSYQGADPTVDVTFAQEPTIELTQSGDPQVTFETAEEREQRQSEQQASNASNGEQSNADGEQSNAAMSDSEGADGEMAAEGSDTDVPAELEASTDAEADTAADGDTGSAESSDMEATDQDMEATDQDMEATDQAEAGAMASGSTMMVSDLMSMQVISANGEDLGSPDAIIDDNGNTVLVVSSGGFLGLGQTQVPVNLSDVTIKGENIVLQDMTEEQIESASDFEYDSSLALSDDTEVSVGN